MRDKIYVNFNFSKYLFKVIIILYYLHMKKYKSIFHTKFKFIKSETAYLKD